MSTTTNQRPDHARATAVNDERTTPPDGASPDHAVRPGNGYPTWRAMSWLFLFRLTIVTGLILVYFPIAREPVHQIVHVTSFRTAVVIYAVLIFVSGLALYVRRPGRQQQVQLAVYVDIVALTFIMHLAGGIGTGLGLLLAIAVTCGALLMEGRLSLLFASFATLGVITQQLYAQLYEPIRGANLTQAGLLGITFFTVAILAHVLYRRIRETEYLAASRQIDIEDLSKLNDHIIQSMETGVMVLDGRLHVRLTNASAEQLLGLTSSGMRRTLRSVARPLYDWIAQEVTGNDGCTGSKTLRIGEREIRASCQINGDRSPASTTLIFLQDNRELAREAQQIKLASLGQLTASIAHNIRNPLSAVSQAEQLLAESPDLNPDDKHLVNIIRRNANRIEETVSSVLQLSRSSAIETQTIDLAPWLPEFCEEFLSLNRLSAANLSVTANAATLPVNVDPRHLHQILSNLCDNALVHACVGGKLPHLDIVASREDAADTVIVDVMDDGPGIDAATARQIFDPFFTTSASGTGLGLYISRELAQTNGIDMEYLARERGGSRFRLTFPTT